MVKQCRLKTVRKTMSELQPEMDENRNRDSYQVTIECDISAPEDYDGKNSMYGHHAAYLLYGHIWEDSSGGYHVIGSDDDNNAIDEDKQIAEINYMTAPKVIRDTIIKHLYQGANSSELTLDSCMLRADGFHEFDIVIAWEDSWEGILGIPAVKEIWPSRIITRKNGDKCEWDGRFNFVSSIYLGHQHPENAARIFKEVYEQAFNYYDGTAKIAHRGF